LNPRKKNSTVEQNGSETNGEAEPKENGTAKEENGTATESGEERKRKTIDVGDLTENEVAEVVPDKKAKLEEKSEGKQEDVVDSPAEQIAA